MTPQGLPRFTEHELDGLYVLPQDSGIGIGGALPDGMGDVRRLGALEDNTAGRHWHEGRGWRSSRERQRAFGAATSDTCGGC